jgi:hypothetical protein
MARFNTKKVTGGPASGIKSRIGISVGDARSKIIAKKRLTMTDARDKLASIAKTMDARQKLQKIRNLKQGKVKIQ